MAPHDLGETMTYQTSNVGLNAYASIERCTVPPAGFNDYNNKETMLEDDGLGPLMSSECLSEPFPCLADELEEQAKALEDAWLCNPATLPLVPTPTKASPPPLPLISVPTGQSSGLENMQQQIKPAAINTAHHQVSSVAVEPLQQQQQQHQNVSTFGGLPPQTPRSVNPQRAASSLDQPNVAPLEPTAAASPALVQTNRAPAIAPLAPRIAPLHLAMRNAQCVCLGKEGPQIGAWRGCASNPWCNKLAAHEGPCNCRASIPGLAAYSPAELQQAGITVADDEEPGVSFKRKALQDAAAADATSDNDNDMCEGPSNGVPLANLHKRSTTATAPLGKRSRRGPGHAAASAPKRGNKAVDLDMLDNDSTSEELRSTTTADAKITDLMVSGARHRGNGRAEDGGIHRHHLGPKAAPIKEAKGINAAAGATGRKTQRQWITDSCVDPRTGETVTVVPPASFCTQCSALNTPVWRAGPFGHKTLCNACGVRYMKVAPKMRK